MKDLTFFKVVRMVDGVFTRPHLDVPEDERLLVPFTEHTVLEGTPGFHVFRTLSDAQLFVFNVQDVCKEVGVPIAVKGLVVCQCFVHGTLRKIRGNLVANKIFLSSVVWLSDVNMIFNNDDEKGEDTNELER